MAVSWALLLLLALSFAGRLEGRNKGGMILIEVDSKESSMGNDYGVCFYASMYIVKYVFMHLGI